MTAEVAPARAAAAKFLTGYVPFLYGQASARSVQAATPGLRRQLSRSRSELTPVERRRHPRVASLTIAGHAPEIVQATTLIEDAGIVEYELRLTLRRHGVGWLVSAVGG